jgi:hypothetical protein
MELLPLTLRQPTGDTLGARKVSNAADEDGEVTKNGKLPKIADVAVFRQSRFLKKLALF